MSDRKVSVEVEVTATNKVGNAAASAGQAAAGQAAAGSPAQVAAAAAQPSIAVTNAAATAATKAAGSIAGKLATATGIMAQPAAAALGIQISPAVMAKAATGLANGIKAAITGVGGFGVGAVGGGLSTIVGNAMTSATNRMNSLASTINQNGGGATGIANSIWGKFGNGPQSGIMGTGMSWGQISFANMKAGLSSAVEGMKQFQGAALAASVAASAAVAATAPATWATFTGSIQLLSGEFANMLIPAFVEVSGWIQTAAGWVKSLDGETKGIISTTAKWAGIVVVGGAAITKLGAIIWPVVTGFGSFAVAAGRAGIAVAAFAISNPWIAGLTAAVGIVGYLTNGFGLLGDSIERASQRAEDARTRITALQSGQGLSRNDFESLPAGLQRRLQSTDLNARRELLQSEIRNAENARDREFGRNPGRIQADIEQRLLDINRTQTGLGIHLTPNMIDETRRNAIRDALIAGGMNRDAATARAGQIPGSSLLGGFATGEMTSEAIRQIAREASGVNRATIAQSNIEVMQRVLSNGVPGVVPSGIAMARTFQPRTYSSGDSFYGDILQQVLGRGELEQRMFQQQMDNDQRLIEEIQGLRRDVRDGTNPAPR